MAITIADPAELGKLPPGGCAICGGGEFAYRQVLWQALIDEWQLSPSEAGYINVQQGLGCRACGGNLRSMVLARAMCTAMSHHGTLQVWLESERARSLAVLEINEAGTLTKHLAVLPGHRLACYPEFDIHDLPFDEGSFDLVVHSDTLEHVANPTHALSECRRILRVGGLLAFTVPVVVGRLTRSRHGLPASFHGSAEEARPDLLVHTEFGADFWAFAIEAGFETATLHADLYPAGLALTARK